MKLDSPKYGLDSKNFGSFLLAPVRPDLDSARADLDSARTNLARSGRTRELGSTHVGLGSTKLDTIPLTCCPSRPILASTRPEFKQFEFGSTLGAEGDLDLNDAQRRSCFVEGDFGIGDPAPFRVALVASTSIACGVGSPVVAGAVESGSGVDVAPGLPGVGVSEPVPGIGCVGRRRSSRRVRCGRASPRGARRRLWLGRDCSCRPRRLGLGRRDFQPA